MSISIGTMSLVLMPLVATTLFIVEPRGSGNEIFAAADHSSPTPAAASAVPEIVKGGVKLRSITVTLPTSDLMFPGGAAADAINNNCIACHSAGMVLTQPALSRADWQAEVNKMRTIYKAPIEEADVAPIVDYLAKTKGL